MCTCLFLPDAEVVEPTPKKYHLYTRERVITPPKMIPAPAETGTFTVFFGWGNVHVYIDVLVCVLVHGEGGRTTSCAPSLCMM